MRINVPKDIFEALCDAIGAVRRYARPPTDPVTGDPNEYTRTMLVIYGETADLIVGIGPLEILE